ncbi:MAG: sulfatase-like hydrolase/transferase [Bryobacterales bacterium]
MPSLKWRFLVLSTLAAVPFIHFLLTHRYGFLYPEVLFALALFLIPCALLAALSKKEVAFHLVALILILLVSTNAIHISLFPDLRLRYILSALAALTAAGMYFMRDKFYYIVLVFAISVLGTDTAQAVVEWASQQATSDSQSNPSSRRHVVYLILDSQIGLAGFPRDIPESAEAEFALRSVLADNQFTIYPNAFSNYQFSKDSIPSILNRRLIPKTGYYFRDEPLKTVLLENALFEQYATKGYAVNAYYSDYIGFPSTEFEVTSRTYYLNSLAVLHGLLESKLRWPSRLHQLLTIYFQADAFLWEAYVRLASERFRPKRLRLGPLAVAHVWPNQLLSDIRTAERDTLFFAHLLTPHDPYVYEATGQVRDPEEWTLEADMDSFERSRYVNLYRRYANQVIYLSRQLGAFLQELRDIGVYDSTTVVIHGDHGSRIRLLKEGERQEWEKLRVSTPDCPYVSRYDYVSEPELRDLLDRFSTLFAVKHAQARESQIMEEKGSVSYFLQKEFDTSGQNIDPNWNSVYLFNADGAPQEIPLLELWNENNEVSIPNDDLQTFSNR